LRRDRTPPAILLLFSGEILQPTCGDVRPAATPPRFRVVPRTAPALDETQKCAGHSMPPHGSHALGWAAMGASAVFIDLDRTLLCHASGQASTRPHGRRCPAPGSLAAGDRFLYAVNDRWARTWFRWAGARRRKGGKGMAPRCGASCRQTRRPRPDRPHRPLRPAIPGGVPGRRPPARPVHHHARRHDHALRRGAGIRRGDRHHLRDEGRALHRAPLRRLRLGTGKLKAVRAWAKAEASTSTTVMRAATASSTSRSWPASAPRTRSTRIPHSR